MDAGRKSFLSWPDMINFVFTYSLVWWHCTTYLIGIRDWHRATFKTFPKSRYWPGNDVLSSLTTSVLVKAKTSIVVVPPFYSLTSPPGKKDMTMSSKNNNPPLESQQRCHLLKASNFKEEEQALLSLVVLLLGDRPPCHSGHACHTARSVRWEYCVCMWILLLFVQ